MSDIIVEGWGGGEEMGKIATILIDVQRSCCDFFRVFPTFSDFFRHFPIFPD